MDQFMFKKLYFCSFNSLVTKFDRQYKLQILVLNVLKFAALTCEIRN